MKTTTFDIHTRFNLNYDINKGFVNMVSMEMDMTIGKYKSINKRTLYLGSTGWDEHRHTCNGIIQTNKYIVGIYTYHTST